MGTDNLFYRRKAKKESEHRREMAKRAPYERILIVCEGAKTEPHYFVWLRYESGLNRMNIVIADKRKGLDPKSLVEYTIDVYNEEKDFNHVYCVFDRDKHTSSGYSSTYDKGSGVRLSNTTFVQFPVKVAKQQANRSQD